MTTTNDDFIALEMDNPTARRAPEAPALNDAIDLDLTDSKAPKCLTCGYSDRPVNEHSICQGCDSAASADVETPIPSALSTIATESASNASVAGIGSQRGPGATMRGVGFSDRTGYVTAIRNGVPAHTHASYLTTLRATYGMTTADIAALNLPGPMALTALPEGAGITHTPTGPSIFERPAAQRQFIVGPKADPSEQEKTVRILSTKDLVAGSIAEGHGALVAWRGENKITRGKIVEALTAIGRSEVSPKANTAHAQAGRAVAALRGRGVDVNAVPKSKGADLAAGTFVWTCGDVNHTGDVGDKYGTVVLVVTLAGDALSCKVESENPALAENARRLATIVTEDYNALIAGEMYASGDVTAWLSGVLVKHHDAIRLGALGWYIPAKHVAAASTLCKAVAGAGFGTDWVEPALPVATSDQLRDGILRGLTNEVADLMARLAAERETAKAERKAGDIGERRAASFLRDLREIGKRCVAYGEIMGADRVTSARQTVHAAITELEGVLGDDFSGISQRFAGIWDEIELDRKRNGGAL